MNGAFLRSTRGMNEAVPRQVARPSTTMTDLTRVDRERLGVQGINSLLPLTVNSERTQDCSSSVQRIAQRVSGHS